VEGSCEYDAVPSIPVKRREIFEYLSDWWLLKKDSVPGSYASLLSFRNNKSAINL
jgi:hypothetical protein